MFSKQDAQCGQFDLVLAEALDRISRDQADVATLFKHLRFAGVPIVTSAEGEITELHLALKGTMNALSAVWARRSAGPVNGPSALSYLEAVKMLARVRRKNASGFLD